jgi:type II secretory pathway predicted ATPase ExeA
VLLAIDEAHLHIPDQLEAIGLLTNADTDSATSCSLLLVGQPTLARQLRMVIYVALDQRIATRYQIAPMDLGESAKYLRHHLAPGSSNRSAQQRRGRGDDRWHHRR